MYICMSSHSSSYSAHHPHTRSLLHAYNNVLIGKVQERSAELEQELLVAYAGFFIVSFSHILRTNYVYYYNILLILLYSFSIYTYTSYYTASHYPIDQGY